MKKLFSLAGVLAFSAGLQAEPAAAPAPDSETVTLPEVTVTAALKLPSDEQWLVGKIGNIEVFSNASEEQTRKFLGGFHTFRSAFELVFPQAKGLAGRPCTFVLCASLEKFQQLTPKMEWKTDRVKSSHFARDAYHTFLLTNLDMETIDITFARDSAPDDEVADGIGLLISRDEVFRREYLHMLFSQFPHRLPLCVEEGLAQMFTSLRVNKDKKGQEKIIWGELDKQFQKFFDMRAMLGVTKLFAVTEESSEYQQAVGSTFTKESLAFVHFCMFAHKQKYKPAFLAFLDRASREPVNEAVFKQIFKKSYGEMEVELRQYIEGQNGAYGRSNFALAAPLPEEPAYELRPATDAERGRIKGEALRLAKRYDEAMAHFAAPIARRHGDAQLIAALGLLEMETGKTDLARLHLEKAVAGKAEDPAAYVALAKLRLEEALRSPAAKEGLTAPLLNLVLGPLYKGIAAGQTHLNTYLQIADAWERAGPGVTVKADSLRALDEGVMAHPRHGELVFRTARLKAKHGFNDEARDLIEVGLAFARDQELRARFEQLKAALPAKASATSAGDAASQGAAAPVLAAEAGSVK